MPGLVRGMARTPAVVGTAHATPHAVTHPQANKKAAHKGGSCNCESNQRFENCLRRRAL